MDKLIQTVEAIVFLSGRPIAISDIADKLSVSLQEVEEAGKALAERYSGESGVHFLCFNKKFQMSTNPDYADSIEQVLNPIREKELTRALLEVCAIIAYRQPVTRLEVEDLRGVNSDYSIALLAKNNLIEVVGRKDAIGKPLLYGTTDEFLKRFGLNSLEDLPDYATVISRIKVLHGAPSQDLFHKDEYVPEEEPALDGQMAIDVGDSAAKDIEHVSAAMSEVSAAEASVVIVSDEEELPEEQTPDFLAGEELQEVSADAEDAEPAEELPDFLAGEELQEVSADAEEAEPTEELPDFLAGEEVESVTADGDELPDFLAGEDVEIIE